ncbi:unnamed protein product, partial [Symbiodinium necroappetens]
ESKETMEVVSNAVNDELISSLDYKMRTSNASYVVPRNDVMYYPSSLSSFTPTTSRVARIPLTSGTDFLDPDSIKVAFRVQNNDATLALQPALVDPGCFVKRVQLFANGQRVEDVQEYGRCMQLYSCLKPKEWWDNRGVEGFKQGNDAFTRPESIAATRYWDVLMAPSLLGLFKAGKMLPPELNLVLEIEFAPPAEAVRPGDAGSEDYEIQNVRVLASQVTLDSALVESFRRVLLSGRSLVFSFPAMHTQVSSIPDAATSHNVTVARAFTKLLGAFVMFYNSASVEGPVRDLRNPSQTVGVEGVMESQMQLGSLQYPHNPMSSTAEHFHFLSILAHTYDSSIKNMRITTDTYRFREFIAAFPTERVPGMPLSGISTRSGDLARFSFKNLAADAVDRVYLYLLSYQAETDIMSLFESSITGNILNDGQTTETSGITAGQLATVLTAYTPLTDTAANTASIGTNSAAVAALQTQVAGLPAPPDLAPYALAADLAAAEGSVAANQSSITALNTSLTTGLAGKALDALQLDVNGKSTPASVDLKLANHPTTAAMNSAIASADNAVLASVAATYGLKTVTDQLAVDVAARQTAADVDQKIATALLPYTDTAGLNAAVALRTTPADVDQKIATALLTYVQQVALDAALDHFLVGLQLIQKFGGLNVLLVPMQMRIVRSWGPSLLAQEPPPTTVEADMSFVLTTLDRWSLSWRQAMGMLNGPGGVSRFRHTSHKVLDCIRLSAHLTGGSSSLVDVVAQSLASVLPEFLREAFIKNVTKPSSNRRLLPSASLIRRYELAFDVALMLLSRKRASSVSSCIRVGWSDSSPLAGYDWIWSQYHEVDKSHLLATFRAISSLQQGVASFVEEQRQLHQDLLDGDEPEKIRWPTSPLPEWVPWLQTLRSNIHEHINPPAAMGSGHRSLSDKAACEVFKWHLQHPITSDLFQHGASYVAHCSDMGVELSLPDFHVSGSVEALLPDWLHRFIPPDIDVDDSNQAVPCAPLDVEDNIDGDFLEDDDVEPGGPAEAVAAPAHQRAGPRAAESFLMPCAFTIGGLQHVVNNLCADVHQGMGNWAPFYSDLKAVEALLRVDERRQRFIWTCLQGTPLEGQSHRFQRFKGSLYESHWHEVLGFLKQLTGLLPTLARAWDSQKYIRGVNLDGQARPAQAQAENVQNQRQGLSVFDPAKVTEAVQSPLFHSYAAMALKLEEANLKVSSKISVRCG